jgi:hypothetical protein
LCPPLPEGRQLARYTKTTESSGPDTEPHGESTMKKMYLAAAVIVVF